MGNLKHGGCSNPLLIPTWRSWMQMKQRCLNKNHKFYEDYGGRGITIHPDWIKFEGFLRDMGVRLVGTTLERIRNGEGYTPANCKWATRMEQGANKRNNRLLTINGETHHVAEWERKMGFRRDAIYDRLRQGWPIERLLEPVRSKPRRKSQVANLL